MRFFGIKPLLIIVVVCLIRMLFPMEFEFTSVIVAPQILNPISDFLYKNVYICVALWVGVAVVLLVKMSVLYRRIFHKVSKIPHVSTTQIDRIASEIVADKHRHRVKVFLTNMASVPMVCGFRNGIILLPNVEYSDQELRLIIEHEYIHFKNNDAYIRLAMQVVYCIFWWNPFVYWMKYGLDNLLEIRCDNEIISRKSRKEIIAYSETLLKFLEAGSNNQMEIITSRLSYDKTFIQRIKLLFQARISTEKQRIYSALMMVFFTGLMLLSYLFVFQSDYLPIQKDTIIDKIMMEQNTDGTYTIRCDGELYVINEDDKRRIHGKSHYPK